jgi:osmotically-inducible protein OsmY
VTHGSTIRWTAVLIAAATLASCATPPQPSVASAASSARAEQGATDEVLANAVYSQLNADPTYYYRHVDVRVDSGVAHLGGLVWSTDAIYRARTIAGRVPGITGVVTSQLELERNGRDTGGPTR